jgi:uncharacterized UBP type Zn finger protein
LEKYFESESIEDYKCEFCLRKVTIEKTTLIWDFPKVLFLFFKRFEWGYNPRKVKGEVAISNDKIDLGNYCVNQKSKGIFQIFQLGSMKGSFGWLGISTILGI